MNITRKQLRKIIKEAIDNQAEVVLLPEPWEINTKAVRMKLPAGAIKIIEKEFEKNRDNPDLNNGHGKLRVIDTLPILEKMGDALGLNPYIPEHLDSIKSALNVFFILEET